eukprot:2743079-Amphidinium_carterae.1
MGTLLHPSLPRPGCPRSSLDLLVTCACRGMQKIQSIQAKMASELEKAAQEGRLAVALKGAAPSLEVLSASVGAGNEHGLRCPRTAPQKQQIIATSFGKPKAI